MLRQSRFRDSAGLKTGLSQSYLII
jgi:hypothetical protein